MNPIRNPGGLASGGVDGISDETACDDLSSLVLDCMT